jgi:hypothetical protein
VSTDADARVKHPESMLMELTIERLIITPSDDVS